MDNNMDELFYRYRPDTVQNRNAFVKDRLYFSTPENFNDPYDAYFYIDKERFWDNVTFALAEGMGSFVTNRVLPDYPKEMQEAMTKLILERLSDEAFSGTFYNQVSVIVDDMKEKMRRNAKIICFSKECLSPLMWAHYADSHRGFVLGYERRALEEAQLIDDRDVQLAENRCKVLEVKYSKKRPDFGEYLYGYVPKYCLSQNFMKQEEMEEPSVKLLHDALSVKSQDWKYEKEWRLIPAQQNIKDNNHIKYINVKPKVIYLGTQLHEKERTELIREARKKKLQVYSVFRNNENAEFLFDRVKV